MSMQTDCIYGYDDILKLKEDAILLPERLPWDYNAAEKDLAPDVLKKILNSYIVELGGQLTPDYIRMEFFG